MPLRPLSVHKASTKNPFPNFQLSIVNFQFDPPPLSQW